MIKVLELFGGIGACTAALKRLGKEFEVVDYVEVDKYAVKSYNAINETSFDPQDICNWDKQLGVDLIMHGSPCQDFSLAGKQAGADEGSGTRSSLMYETIRIVEKLKPKYVIWENVKNVLSKKHKHNFDNYLQRMKNMGYTNFYSVLNAKDFGIPQNRERVFVVSIYKGEAYEFPGKKELKLRLKDLLEDEVEEKYFLSEKAIRGYEYHAQKNHGKGNGFGGKPTDGNGCAQALQTTASKSNSTYVVCESKCIQTGQIYGTETEPNPQAGRVYDSLGISPTLDTCSGGNRMPKVLVKNANKKGYDEACVGDSVNLEQPNSKTRRGRVGHGVSQGLNTSCKQGVVVKNQGKSFHTSDCAATLLARDYKGFGNQAMSGAKIGLRIRRLTPKECWRLMGFLDSEFSKAEAVNSNTQLYKQAGNSIVVDVLAQILKKLLEQE